MRKFGCGTMRFGLRTVRGAGGGAAGQASSRILATVAAHALSVCLLTTNGLSGGLLPPAYAGSAPLNEEQKLAASAWKETDRIFVDRTFGNQDWFKRREKLRFLTRESLQMRNLLSKYAEAVLADIVKRMKEREARAKAKEEEESDDDDDDDDED